METIGAVFSSLYNVWKEMFKEVTAVLPRAFKLFIWFFLAIFILPCVFVSGVIYPKWLEWGDKM